MTHIIAIPSFAVVKLSHGSTIGVILSGAASLTFADDNGFDLTGTLVPVDEIHPGGPPRDGIPAIDAPRFVGAEDADFLEPTDRVLGLEHNGLTRAYPIAIMNWHEIVNDRVGEDAVVVTYCPLCGTGVAFESHVADRDLSFGVPHRQGPDRGSAQW